MKPEYFIELLVKRADREPLQDGDLVVVTIQRFEGSIDSRDLDNYICRNFPIGPKKIVLESNLRKYEVLNWDWDKNTYGFLLKVIK